MKISIITVCFNAQKTIIDCIESVIGQTYPNIEYIIIDGNSTDNTLQKIEPYRNKISKLISEPDRGIYDAMNKGIAVATGQVVGILNADDVYASKQVIARVAEAFCQQNTQALYADLVYMDESLTKVKRYWKSGNYKPNAFLWGWMPPHPTFFVKKNIYDTLGTFRTDLRIAADYELMLRFIHRHRISIQYLPQIIVKMREGGVSNASVQNRVSAGTESYQAWLFNGLKPYFFTLPIKILRKIPQFFPFGVTVP